jgi:hypothetical protein
MKDLVKEGDVVGGPEGSALRGAAGGSMRSARLHHADDDAISDPALYQKHLDRGTGEAR